MAPLTSSSIRPKADAAAKNGSHDDGANVPLGAHRAVRIRDEPALTFDDVLLAPRHSQTHPKEVDIKSRLSRGIGLNVPLISAAMD
ncbi:MAG: IMP dehydrogenase, partial [Gemmatimonadota bacterium]|nr:IMP dehydrogenase [Gemmatimonadota bacterium]